MHPTKLDTEDIGFCVWRNCAKRLHGLRVEFGCRGSCALRDAHDAVISHLTE